MVKWVTFEIFDRTRMQSQGIDPTFDLKKEEALMEYLTNKFGFEVFTPGLERTRPVYAPFINYFKSVGTKVVIVAGTNGKGQTAHTLNTLFTLEGKSVALWTSPHILSLRERFLFSQEKKAQEVSYAELEWAMNEGQRILTHELQGVKVSFYEFLFLVFLIIAKKMGRLDYLLLEVGLGGRLDAVNHFDADCACITSISRDHQSILGPRYDMILAEKIAVSRQKKALFTNFSLKYLNELTASYVKEHEVQWRKLPPSDNYFLANQKLAWEMFEFLESKSVLTWEEGMSHLPLYKGRREIMTFQGMSLIFIGAHNTDGIRKMLASFSDEKNAIRPESLLVSFSGRPVVEVEVMLKSLLSYFDDTVEIKLASFDHPKALDRESIKAVQKKVKQDVKKGMLNLVVDWKSELQKNNSQKEPKTILVCGSYYFIGEVQRFISA